ncbi:MAG: M48 family metalloprotease [Armatimonadota bacterium]
MGWRIAHAHRSTAWALAAIMLVATLALPEPATAALLGEADEIRIGRQAAEELEAEIGVATDPAMTARLAGIGRRVAAVSERPGLPWTFRVLRSREVNAISLPGGFIYATEGMMRFVQSDHELAFVMAHEVGHVSARHHVAMIERHYFYVIVARVLFGSDPTSSQIADIVRFFLSRGFSRDNEFEADRLAVSFAHRARFDAAAGLSFMQRLRAAEGRDPSQFETLFRTHPGLSDRIARVREHLRGLGYRVLRGLLALVSGR